MSSEDSSNNNFKLGPALEFLRCLWEVNHSLEQLSSRMEKRIGVTAQQRLMLRCIGQHPGISAGQLAQLLHVDPGTVSASLRRLEEREFLRRKRDPRDNRRVSLELTNAGIAIDKGSSTNAENAVQQLLASSEQRQIDSAVNTLQQLATLLDSEFSDKLDAT